MNTLDSHQVAAVRHSGPRILLRAAAGSGKTRTLVARVERLLGTGVDPARIVVLTFTRAAAMELRGRLRGSGEDGVQRPKPLMTTFHSLAARVLRDHGAVLGIPSDFTVRGEQDRDELLKVVAVELSKTGKKPSELIGWLSQPLHPQTRKRLERDPDIMRRYSAMTREANAVDFDELERLLLVLLPMVGAELRATWTHVLVDEAQDTSETQQRTLDLLDPSNLFVVGDLSQSIYSFRGAHPEGFAERPGWQVLDLPTNYRSVPAVVAAANGLARAMAVPGLDMQAARPAQEGDAVGVLRAPSREELAEVVVRDLTATHELPVLADTDPSWTWSDLAVLAPTWRLLDTLRPVLESSGIPYRLARRGGDVWDTPEARWLIACLRVATNPRDYSALLGALQAFTHRVGPEVVADARARTMESERSILDVLGESRMAPAAAPILNCLSLVAGAVAAGQDDLDILDALSDCFAATMAPHGGRVEAFQAAAEAVQDWFDGGEEEDGIPGFLDWYAGRRLDGDREEQETENAVTLSTIHGAKGLEWPAVWLLGWEEGHLPRGDADAEEGRRLAYVAVTRAQDRLRVCVSTHREPSRFLAEAVPGVPGLAEAR